MSKVDKATIVLELVDQECVRGSHAVALCNSIDPQKGDRSPWSPRRGWQIGCENLRTALLGGAVTHGELTGV